MSERKKLFEIRGLVTQFTTEAGVARAVENVDFDIFEAIPQLSGRTQVPFQSPGAACHHVWRSVLRHRFLLRSCRAL